MDTLNIIGAGRAGRTLGRLFAIRQTFAVGDILTRSYEHSADAAAFIGAGRPANGLDEVRPAQVWLLGVPDDAVAEVARSIAEAGLVRQGDIAFHCSGSATSGVLEPLRSRGALIASVHPVKSLADPARAAQAFGGTYCGFEGDPAAIGKLKDAFRQIGAIPFDVSSETKMLYHAGAVIACNCLTALLEVALQCYEAAGMDRATALKVVAPLVRNTVENNLTLGPARALTGPVARGDQHLVAEQYDAVREWDEDAGDVYRALGRIAVDLARAQGSAPFDSIEALDRLFADRPPA